MKKKSGSELLCSTDFFIQKAFEEDVGSGDITTEALAESGNETTTADVKSKQNLAILSGMKVVCKVIAYYNQHFSQKNKFQSPKKPKSPKSPKDSLHEEPITIIKAIKDGSKLKHGDIILRLQGKVKDLLITERIILNFLQQLSGIATATYNIVHSLKGSSIKLLDTRKTTPGFRALVKYAVRCGGGLNHRMGLYDLYLIKDNHIDRAGGITNALWLVTKHQAKIKSATKPKIEIECRTLAEVQEVIAFNQAFHKNLKKFSLNRLNKPSQSKAKNIGTMKGVEIIMLDNFSSKDTLQALNLIGKEIKVEVSGNMNSKKIKSLLRISKLGKRSIDFISAGMITHSAPAVDYSMTIK